MNTKAGASQGFNEGVAPNNSLHQLLSLAASPVASVCIALGLKPFAITTISNGLIAIALLLLWKSDLPLVFTALWVTALVLDFADGIVARRTGTSSANGSFYDHFSDKVKVALLFLVSALRYGTLELWVLGAFASNLFLLLSAVNQELAFRTFRLEQGSTGRVRGSGASAAEGEAPVRPGLARRVKALMGRLLPQSRVFRGIYFSLTMLQGNAMILVLPIAFGEDPAFWATLWFALLCFKSLFFIVRAEITINRRLSEARISWK